jgi:hypothetical protein
MLEGMVRNRQNKTQLFHKGVHANHVHTVDSSYPFPSPLDLHQVYYMLFLATAGTAMFLIGEMIWPQSFLATCGRLFCTYIQV